MPFGRNQQWPQQYPATTGLSGALYNNYIWDQWTANTTSAYAYQNFPLTTATTQLYTDPGLFHNTNIWIQWNGQHWIDLNRPHHAAWKPAQVPPEVVRRNQLVALNRERSRKLRTKIAERAAEDLLVEHLTPEQREEYERLQRFSVIVGDKEYRIRRGMHGNIDLLEEGKVKERLCVYATGGVPVADNILAQKLMLEAGLEEELRRTANITRMTA